MKLPSIVIINKQNFIFTLIFLVFLISVNLIIGQIFGDVIDRIVLERDESIHISISDSFREHQNFTTDFLGRVIFNAESFDDMITFYPTISHEQGGKGPLFYIFLGSFFEILDSKPSELFTHSLIFTQIISSTFIVLFFFLIKREFGLKVAMLSSILVLLTPFFAWAISVRPIPMPLLYVFSIATFFFLKKKTSHYVLFGIFAGLAHLTHPFGIFLAISYPIYLLINREFKGFIITIGVWHAVMIPWFIRNYYVFEDIGMGLYVPFSSKISSLLTFLPHKESTLIGSPNFLPSNYVDVSLIFTSIRQELSDFYSMDILVIFIFSIFLILFIKYFINIIFHKQKISFPSSRFVSFFLVFGIISVLGYFYTQFWWGQVLPILKQLMFVIFISIPIFVFGLNNIINSRLKIFNRRKKIILNIFLVMILLPLSLQMIYGIEMLSNYSYYYYEETEMSKLNEWIVTNIPKNDTNADSTTASILKSNLPQTMISPLNIPPVTMTASNIPSTTNIKTNLQSIMLPPSNYSSIEMEYFLHYYDITYIIFYDHSLLANVKGDPDFNKSPDHFFSKYDSLLSVYVDEIHNEGNSKIYQIIPITDAFISQPDLFIRNALFLDREGRHDVAQDMYDKLFYSDNTMMKMQICPTFIKFKNYEQGIIFCSDLLKNNSRNLVALYNLGLSYENTEQQDKAIEILDKYDQLLNENPNNIHTILISKGNLVNELINLDQYYVDMVDNMLIKANEFENEGIFDMAIKLYDELTYVEKAKFVSHVYLINLYLKNSDYDEAFKHFDIIIPNIKENLKSNIFTGKNSKIASQKNIINLLYEKGDIHLRLNDLYDAREVYAEILNFDKFVSMPWQKLAFIDETQGNHALALHEYELASQFEPENHTLLEKIEELKVLLNK